VTMTARAAPAPVDRGRTVAGAALERIGSHARRPRPSAPSAARGLCSACSRRIMGRSFDTPGQGPAARGTQVAALRRKEDAP
jgi:hypothetical protein